MIKMIYTCHAFMLVKFTVRHTDPNCEGTKPTVSESEHAGSLGSLSRPQLWGRLSEEASRRQSCPPAATNRGDQGVEQVKGRLTIMEDVCLALSTKHKDLWRAQLFLRRKLSATRSNAVAGAWSIQGHMRTPLGPHQGQRVTAPSPTTNTSAWQSPYAAGEAEEAEEELCCCCERVDCCPP